MGKGVLNYERDELARLTDHVKNGDVAVGAPYLVAAPIGCEGWPVPSVPSRGQYTTGA